jgi:hypothetical protein
MSNTSPLVGLFLAREVKVKNLSFDQGNYTRNIIVNNADYWLGLLHTYRFLLCINLMNIIVHFPF